MDGDEVEPESVEIAVSSIPEEEPVFASTGATLILPSQMPRDPRMHVALLFILFSPTFSLATFSGLHPME